MATDRTAQVVWQGDLLNGRGTIQGVTSGALAELDVTWASRSEEPQGRTSPEELIAAAWASCFSMAFAAGLAKLGHPPDLLETSVTVTFQPGEGITKGALTVKATVPGIEPGAFDEAAENAKRNCPVSKALSGIPEVSLDATLEG
jgi:osmotically inducible protein OsmC